MKQQWTSNSLCGIWVEPEVETLFLIYNNLCNSYHVFSDAVGTEFDRALVVSLRTMYYMYVCTLWRSAPLRLLSPFSKKQAIPLRLKELFCLEKCCFLPFWWFSSMSCSTAMKSRSGDDVRLGKTGAKRSSQLELRDSLGWAGLGWQVSKQRRRP